MLRGDHHHIKRKLEVDIQAFHQRMGAGHGRIRRRKQIHQQSAAHGGFRQPGLQHAFQLIILGGVNLQQVGNIADLIRIPLNAHNADDVSVDPQGHMTAFAGAGVPVRLTGVDIHHSAGAHRIHGTLVIRAHPPVLRGGNDHASGIHNIDDPAAYQRGGHLHQFIGQFFQQHFLPPFSGFMVKSLICFKVFLLLV